MKQAQLEKLLSHLTEIVFGYNQVVYKAGSKPLGVYFIQSGTFEVSKQADLSKPACEQTSQLGFIT